jgi:hypothetical protein
LKGRHYATCRKVAGSKPDEVDGFLKNYIILPAALDLGVYSTSNRNDYQKEKMVLGSRAWSMRDDHKLAAICEPIV